MSWGDRRWPYAMTVAVIGSALITVAIIGIVLDGDDSSEQQQAAASTTEPVPETTEQAPTTTTPPATSAPPTTVATTTSPSTTPPTTTAAPPTTTRPAETLDEFVTQFNEANLAGDISFAFDRLHPTVIDSFGADACQAFLEQRFTGTTINLTGTQTTPGPFDLALPGDTSATIAAYFTAEVELTFQGTPSAAVASFANEDGIVTWFTNCEALS